MLPYPSLDQTHFPIVLVALMFFAIAVIGVAVMIVPYWVIFKKAGFSPWISLLMFIPLANIITLYVVAFSPWKVVPALSGYSGVSASPGPG